MSPLLSVKLDRDPLELILQSYDTRRRDETF